MSKKIRKGCRVFLDASCWIAAAGSSQGGSAFIIRLAQARQLKIVATRRVLREAERNITEKMSREALLRYYRLLGETDIEIGGPPTVEEENQWRDIVADKDLHVLSGSYKAGAEVLVSLDRRHIVTERVKRAFPVGVCDTKEFLEKFLQ